MWREVDCNADVGRDDGDDGFLIDNFVYRSIVLICICVLRAFVSYYLFCRWSRKEMREEDRE